MIILITYEDVLERDLNAYKTCSHTSVYAGKRMLVWLRHQFVFMYNNQILVHDLKKSEIQFVFSFLKSAYSGTQLF